MDNPVTKEYFEEIAKKFNVDVDLIKRIAYGELAGLKYSLVLSVLQEFIIDPDKQMIFAMIWKGDPVDGAINNFLQYDWGGQVIEGLNLKLHRTEFATQLFLTNSIIADHDYYESLLAKRPGAGFVIIYPGNMLHLQKFCDDRQIPFIALVALAEMDMSSIYMIRIDDKVAMKNNVQYLYNSGHRKIAFITGIANHDATTERLKGYREGLDSVGLDVIDDWIFEGDWREESGYRATQYFLELDEKPTAIIASNDLMAMGAIQHIQSVGLHVPRDISVMGFDDIALALNCHPPLTTVRIPMTGLGKKASEYMMRLLNGEQPEPRHCYVTANLIIRESTAPPETKNVESKTGS